MAHNTFVLLQLLEYDRQESGMNIYNALKIKAQSVPDGHSHQISPIYFLGCYLTIVPLMLLKFCEFINQCLVNDKLLVSVSSWRFVFMRTNTFHQEACHFEIGISE